MSKPLLGGGVAAVALLSVSLLFLEQPSVAETTAATSHEFQQKGVATQSKVIGADMSPSTDAPAETGDTIKDTEEISRADHGIPLSAGGKRSPEVEEEASAPVSFTATAYSLRGRTASGRSVSRGIIAADRRVLPIGTRVRLEAGSYSGEYTVADTGGSVRGRRIDIWVPSTGEAMRFGRRAVRLTVLTRTRPRTQRRQGRR